MFRRLFLSPLQTVCGAGRCSPTLSLLVGLRERLLLRAPILEAAPLPTTVALPVELGLVLVFALALGRSLGVTLFVLPSLHMLPFPCWRNTHPLSSTVGSFHQGPCICAMSWNPCSSNPHVPWTLAQLQSSISWGSAAPPQHWNLQSVARSLALFALVPDVHGTGRDEAPRRSMHIGSEVLSCTCRASPGARERKRL